MRVAAVLMEILRRSGVRHLFGNPGTTELPFLDALPDSGLEYVVALQEATAVAAADGYAQASGQVGVVNVHVAPGVANGLSILHNAARSKTPLLVTAGQQDTRFLLHEPILSGDLVQLTEQFTKWSYEVRRADEAPSALRRALKLALTPPTGPVFLSLPMDLMAEVVDDAGDAAPALASLTRPEASALQRAAEILGAAKSPVIIAGDGVARAGASAQVRVDEVGDQVQTVRRGQMPLFAISPEVALLYRFATEHPKAFEGVECTCGCTRIGHVTNRLCYIKAETAEQVTYTSHAAT